MFSATQATVALTPAGISSSLLQPVLWAMAHEKHKLLLLLRDETHCIPIYQVTTATLIINLFSFDCLTFYSSESTSSINGFDNGRIPFGCAKSIRIYRFWRFTEWNIGTLQLLKSSRRVLVVSVLYLVGWMVKKAFFSVQGLFRCGLEKSRGHVIGWLKDEDWRQQHWHKRWNECNEK